MKMTFEEFVTYMVNNINDLVPEDVKGKAKTDTIRKPNLTYTGLTLVRGEDEALPTANLEAFYKLYQETDLETVLNELVDCLSMKTPPVDASFKEILRDWDKARNHLAVRLIRQKGNEALMEDGPYELIEDLMLIYTLNIDSGDGLFSTRITNDILQSLEIGEEELKEKALELAAENNPAQIMPMSEEMTVVTTGKMNLGAGALFYPGLMEDLAVMLQGSYYLIPSSIHEWLAVPEGVAEPESLLEMIREANGTVVEEKDVLSDNLYRYDADAKAFKKVLFGEAFVPVRSQKGAVLYA